MPEAAPSRPCSSCHEPMERVASSGLAPEGPPVTTWACRNAACSREGELVLVQAKFRTGES